MVTPGKKVKTFTIDGKDVSGTEDQTVIEVCRENNIEIPTLCHLDGLTEVGACRLCLVEIKGTNKLLPACVTKVAEGMEVITASDRLKNYRIKILELFFSERNHICSVCVSNGICELQNLAQKLGMTHVHYPYLFPKVNVDASHERFVLDHNRCILCTRCVRVCDEIEGAHTWDIMGRGIESMVITDLNKPWGDSDSCTSCGKCIAVCPTGALVEKYKNAVDKTSKYKKDKLKFLPYLTTMREVKNEQS